MQRKQHVQNNVNYSGEQTNDATDSEIGEVMTKLIKESA
jgi:hypothetical protein